MSAFDPKRTFPEPVGCSAVASFLSAWLGCGSGRSECGTCYGNSCFRIVGWVDRKRTSFVHAQPGHSGAAASHENHDVQHYADLAIEPGDGGCPHSASGPTHDQDEGLCKKCCAVCLGASLIPSPPLACEYLRGPTNLWSCVATIWSRAQYQQNPEYPNLSEIGQPHRRNLAAYVLFSERHPQC